MAIYVVLRAGHGLQVGDCLIGSDHFRREGSTQFRFRAYSENGQEDRGEVHLPLDWIRANVQFSFREESRETPAEETFLQEIGFIPPPRRVPVPPLGLGLGLPRLEGGSKPPLRRQA